MCMYCSVYVHVSYKTWTQLKTHSHKSYWCHIHVTRQHLRTSEQHSLMIISHFSTEAVGLFFFGIALEKRLKCMGLVDKNRNISILCTIPFEWYLLHWLNLNCYFIYVFRKSRFPVVISEGLYPHSDMIDSSASDFQNRLEWIPYNCRSISGRHGNEHHRQGPQICK